MASGVYNRGLKELLSGATKWDASTIKVMLLKPTYGFNRDHSYVADVVAHELSSANYVRKTLASPTSTQDDVADAAFLDGADITWTAPAIAAGQTAAFAVAFRDTSNDATSPLLACWDIVDTDPGGIAFKLVWNTAGMLKGVSG